MIEATVRETRTVAFCFGRFGRRYRLAKYFPDEMNVTAPDIMPTRIAADP
ncbi:hypothetical protein [Paraburkholderia ultramafica]|nr:hypothetical protein [Paraburkholderia ultramafica]